MHYDLLAIQTLGGFFWTALIGLVTGIIAKFLTPGRDPGGCIVTMIIGVVGAYVALFIGQALHFYAPGDSPGLIASVIGAVILLAIYHATIGRKGGPTA